MARMRFHGQYTCNGAIRLMSILAFAAVAATMILSFFGAPVWTALFGAAVLAAISLSDQHGLRLRLTPIGSADILLMGGLASLASACLAAGAAYGVGRVLSWLYLIG
jgi:hypothetical protein